MPRRGGWSAARALDTFLTGNSGVAHAKQAFVRKGPVLFQFELLVPEPPSDSHPRDLPPHRPPAVAASTQARENGTSAAMYRVAAVAVVVWLLGGFGLLQAAALAKQTSVHAPEVARKLQMGIPEVLNNGTTIDGDLQIGSNRVREAFVCRGCTFNGNVYASYARFARGIDLSGSTVKGEVHLENSVFSGPALFSGAKFGNTINGSFATFHDIADFEDVEFCCRADFKSAHFGGAARYGGAIFGLASIFHAARFDKQASFERGSFAGPVDFSATTFGDVADFRQAAFGASKNRQCEKTVCFTDAVLRGPADFSDAVFSPPAVFGDAKFAMDVSFRRAVFDSSVSFAPSVSFAQTTIGGRLDLSTAKVNGLAQLKSLSVKELVLRDTVFGAGSKLGAEALLIGDLVASLDAINLVPEDTNRAPLLRVLESSARARGNLGLANDAHFQLQEIAARDDWLPRRVADYVLYRIVAGYFVRPLWPLFWLIFIVGVATCLRAFRSTRKHPASVSAQPRARSRAVSTRPGRAHVLTVLAAGGTSTLGEGHPETSPADQANARERLSRRFGSVVGGFVRALGLTITGREEPSPLRRAEVFVYVFLIACFLLALANTNPTLRSMFDALH